MSDTLEPATHASTSTRPDVDCWPDIHTVPGNALRGHIARILFARVARRIAVRIALPDGRLLGTADPRAPLMRLYRPEAFYRRVGAGGLIGFGEAYMAGDWDADDLAGVLTVFARQMSTLVPPRLQRLRDLAVAKHPDDEEGTTANARRNISRHYDLSNALFAQFLDETMTYSSALFPVDEVGRPVARWDALADAQRAKIDRLLDGAGVTAGSSVLEIGTGWGELAVRAAARGATVRSITLSEEQQKLARRRVAEAGFSDRVTIDLCDYRLAAGQYDAIVSVEMIEAVGFDFLPGYFDVLERRLRPGGRVGLQAITMPHDRMLASRDTYTWIHKYVFPGGLVPSVTAVEENVERTGTLRVVDDVAFGAHYAETLRLWRDRFWSDTDAIDALGFDAIFRRMWTLYLAYSEAGFRSGYLDVHQLVLAKADQSAHGIPSQDRGAS